MYNLEGDIAYIAWELAHWQDGLAPRERQALILLILLALIQLRQGSTRIALQPATTVTRSEPKSSPRSLQACCQLRDQRPWSIPRSDRIDGDTGRIGPIGRNRGIGSRIQASDRCRWTSLSSEDFTAGKPIHGVIHRRMEAAIVGWPPQQVEHALADVLARPSVRNGKSVGLNDDQQEAVLAAVRFPVTIVSGGPGTGKTTIVMSILRTFVRLGVAVRRSLLLRRPARPPTA